MRLDKAGEACLLNVAITRAREKLISGVATPASLQATFSGHTLPPQAIPSAQGTPPYQVVALQGDAVFPSPIQAIQGARDSIRILTNGKGITPAILHAMLEPPAKTYGSLGSKAIQTAPVLNTRLL